MSEGLKPHQARVLNKLLSPSSPRGVIAYHSMGSGKTLTALRATEEALKQNPNSRGLFIVPAPLQENVRKEIKKHGLGKLDKKIDVLSYDRAANLADKLKRKNYALTVFDEAHRLRNTDTSRVQKLKPLIQSSNKLLMLTGTAAYNHPSDMASLIKLINPDENIPTDRSAFEDAYIDNKTWKLKNKKQLSSVLNKYVDRYQVPTNNENFPSVSRRVVEVEMSPAQASMYKTVERSIPAEIRAKLKKNLPMTLKDANRLNVFSQGVRQVSDSTVHHNIHGKYSDSPKIMAAVKSMIAASKKPGFRGIVYSNYIDSGLRPYKDALEANGIKPLVFTGSLSQNEKQDIVNEYNSKSKKPKILLLSSSGSEGLDLKRTRLMQLLEPHFNKSKLDQAEGRAIRYQSHIDLPKKDQHVVVEEYHSTLPKTFLQKLFNRKADTAIDTYLADVSNKKQKVVEDMNNLLKTAAIKDAYDAAEDYLQKYASEVDPEWEAENKRYKSIKNNVELDEIYDKYHNSMAKAGLTGLAGGAALGASILASKARSLPAVLGFGAAGLAGIGSSLYMANKAQKDMSPRGRAYFNAIQAHMKPTEILNPKFTFEDYRKRRYMDAKENNEHYTNFDPVIMRRYGF